MAPVNFGKAGRREHIYRQEMAYLGAIRWHLPESSPPAFILARWN